MPKEEKTPQQQDDYLKSRNKNLNIDQYKKVGDKPGGQSTGAIYKSINKKDKNEYLIKETRPSTSVKNFIASCINKLLLGFEAVEDELVIANGKDLYIKSKWVGGLLAGIYPDEKNELPFDRITNLEKVAVSKMFLHDTDFKNANNMGYVETKKHGAYAFGLDYEQVSLDTLSLQVGNYVNSGLIKTFFINEKFAKACEEVGNYSPDHVYFHMKYAIDYLKLVFKSMDSESADQIVKQVVSRIVESRNDFNEYLVKSDFYNSLTPDVQQGISDFLADQGNVEAILDGLEVLSQKFNIDFQVIILSSMHFALCDMMNKGIAQMKDIAQIVRLEIAIKNNDPEQFRQVLTTNPNLLYNSNRPAAGFGNSDNEMVAIRLFESLVQIPKDKRSLFVDAINQTQNNLTEFKVIADRWNKARNEDNHFNIIPNTPPDEKPSPSRPTA